MVVGGQRHALAALPPEKRPGTHYLGGWVGSRANLDRFEKSHPDRDSIPGPSTVNQCRDKNTSGWRLLGA
jgi:hypothetical protein